MADLHVTEGVDADFVRRLGFNAQIIEQVMFAPDDRQVIDFEGRLTIELYVKRMQSRNRPCVVVVAVDRKPGKDSLVFVLRLYNDFDRDISECTPVELVELVAARFGGLVEIARAR